MSDKMGLSDEVRLSDDLVFDEFVNSVGEKVVTARRDRDVLMTAKMLARLYGVDVSTVRKQLKDIFADKTLNKKAVSEIIAHRADDGKLYETRYYDESVIVELARRLRSEEAKALREWLDGKN
ncbi:MAG: hypothetical protein LBQ02_00885 [Candidatus Nomurabacteria bacterium]|nr:hypothetical protein [Candidatus Nomurabacteria bacterium]